MKLYFTAGSPYARMTRIVVIEKQLQARVEMVQAQTRQAQSPHDAINPSGRVPYLDLGDGSGMESATTICAYLDQIDGEPTLTTPRDVDTWAMRRLEASAHSTLEGLSVWARERPRPEHEQSPAVIAHETARAGRMLDVWESQMEQPLPTEPLNMLQLVLACALGLEMRTLGNQWRASHPKLARWYDAIVLRPSFVATQPPAAH